MRRVIPLAACLMLAALSVHAQNVGESLPRLTNKEILEMVKAGLSSDVIISKIKVSRCNFDTEPSVLAELKQKGVSNELLKAMIEAPYGTPKIYKPQEKATPKPQPQLSSELPTAASKSSGQNVLADPLPAAVPREGPQPDRWRGLVLEQSTPEDAMRILGQPASDNLSKIYASRIQSWLSKKAKEKIFRALEFKKPEGIDKAILYFLDGRLVAIGLDMKKGIAPGALSNIYGIEFQPAVGAMDIAFRPRDYEMNQGRVYPKTYPTVYSMVAVSERSFIDAMVANVPSLGGALARSAGIPDQPGTFPGKVEFVTLVSRTLENRDGSDVLK